MSSNNASNSQIERVQATRAIITKLEELVPQVSKGYFNFSEKVEKEIYKIISVNPPKNIEFYIKNINPPNGVEYYIKNGVVPKNSASTVSTKNFTNKDVENIKGFDQLIMSILSVIYATQKDKYGDVLLTIVGFLKEKGNNYLFKGFNIDNATGNSPNSTKTVPQVSLSQILKPIDIYPGYNGPQFRTSDYISKDIIELVSKIGWTLIPGEGFIFNAFMESVGYFKDMGVSWLLDKLFTWNDDKTTERYAADREKTWNDKRNLSNKLAAKAFNGTYPQLNIAAVNDKNMRNAFIYFLQTDDILYNWVEEFETWKTERLQESSGNPYISMFDRNRLIKKGEEDFLERVNGRLENLIQHLWHETSLTLKHLQNAQSGINKKNGTAVPMPPIYFVPPVTYAAAGGFTDGISIAGEAGTEAVISFDPAYHSQNIGYWEKAGELLGVYSTEEALMNAYNHENSVAYNSLSNYAGKLLESDDFTLGAISGNGSVIYDFGGIKFAPDIHIAGNSESREEIVKVIKESEHEFQDMFDEWFENWKKRRGAERYANSYNRVY